MPITIEDLFDRGRTNRGNSQARNLRVDISERFVLQIEMRRNPSGAIAFDTLWGVNWPGRQDVGPCKIIDLDHGRNGSLNMSDAQVDLHFRHGDHRPISTKTIPHDTKKAETIDYVLSLHEDLAAGKDRAGDFRIQVDVAWRAVTFDGRGQLLSFNTDFRTGNDVIAACDRIGREQLEAWILSGALSDWRGEKGGGLSNIIRFLEKRDFQPLDKLFPIDFQTNVSPESFAEILPDLDPFAFPNDIPIGNDLFCKVLEWEATRPKPDGNLPAP